MKTESEFIIHIKEKSFFARIARWKLNASAVAMVLGKTIHLSGVTKEEFLKDQRWVAHEQVHIEQFKKYGYMRFLMLYFWESVRKGYYHNRFEVEARDKSR